MHVKRHSSELSDSLHVDWLFELDNMRDKQNNVLDTYKTFDSADASDTFINVLQKSHSTNQRTGKQQRLQEKDVFPVKIKHRYKRQKFTNISDKFIYKQYTVRPTTFPKVNKSAHVNRKGPQLATVRSITPSISILPLQNTSRATVLDLSTRPVTVKNKSGILKGSIHLKTSDKNTAQRQKNDKNITHLGPHKSNNNRTESKIQSNQNI